jgi:hypothetical protein
MTRLNRTFIARKERSKHAKILRILALFTGLTARALTTKIAIS